MNKMSVTTIKLVGPLDNISNYAGTLKSIGSHGFLLQVSNTQIEKNKYEKIKVCQNRLNDSRQTTEEKDIRPK